MIDRDNPNKNPEPRNKEEYAQRAEEHLFKENYNLAIADATEAIKLDAGYALAYIIRAEAYGYRINPNGINSNEVLAMADANKAIQINGNISRFYATRAGIYEYLHSSTKALEDANKAIQLDKNGIFAYLVRAESNKALGNYAKAVSDATQALQIDPCRSYASKTRGDSYRKLGRYDEAIADATIAAKNAKRFFYRIFAIRAAAYLGKGDIILARADAEKSLKLQENYCAYTVLASISLRKKQFEDAISQATKAIALKPKKTGAYELRAEAYKRNNQTAAAFSDEKKIFDLQTASKTAPSLRNLCKFFIFHNHGTIVALNGVRHFIENAIPATDRPITDELREGMHNSNITPDTIDLMRSQQKLITGTPTLFDEIRKEEHFFLQCNTLSRQRASKRRRLR